MDAAIEKSTMRKVYIRLLPFAILSYFLAYIDAMGFYGSKGPFWAMPPMFLTGTAAAGAIAWINSLGNLGGFFCPWYVGLMQDLTGSYAGGLCGLALFGLISAFVSAFFLHIPNPAASGPALGALEAAE